MDACMEQRHAVPVCHFVEGSCTERYAFQFDLLPDILIVLTIFIHRFVQTRFGLWNIASEKEARDHKHFDSSSDDTDIDNDGTSVTDDRLAATNVDHVQGGAMGQENGIITHQDKNCRHGNDIKNTDSVAKTFVVLKQCAGRVVAVFKNFKNSDNKTLRTTSTKHDGEGEDAMLSRNVDYYFGIFCIQVVSTLTIIFGYQAGFSLPSEANTQDATSFVQDNSIPPLFLMYAKEHSDLYL